MKAKTKTQKIIDWFVKHPSSDVKVVAKKFDAAVPMVYKLRKRAMDTDVVNKALEDMLKMPPMPEPRIYSAQTNKDTVDDVLNARGETYGKFIEGAEIMQMTKRLVRNYIAQRGTELAFDQLEAIDMILHKLGRIINGNPDHTDNWVDIAGYATLVADRLKGNAR